MFVYNLKLTKTNIFKIFLIIFSLLIIVLFCIAGYKIISSSLNNKVKVNDSIFNGDVAKLTVNNYTDVLKMVHDNLDTYIGQKICFSGYIYRAPDFSNNEFVLARNMLINNHSQSLIVGFLCECDKISSYEDNTWVEITGEITRGYYNNEIPIIKITKIEKIDKPEDEFVYPPDDTYIPTSVIL